MRQLSRGFPLMALRSTNSPVASSQTSGFRALRDHGSGRIRETTRDGDDFVDSVVVVVDAAHLVVAGGCTHTRILPHPWRTPSAGRCEGRPFVFPMDRAAARWRWRWQLSAKQHRME